MQDYLPVLRRSQLFSGIGEAEISTLLDCLGAQYRSYQKGDYVFRQGEYLSQIAVLAAGQLHIQREDYWGNSNILSTVTVGDMFGEAYAAPNSGAILTNVIAVEDSTILFLDARRILTTCSSACRFHAAVVQNLFSALSETNRQLLQKLGHMAHRTTREKLMSYLSEESARQKSVTFTIPFNRQQLADFLSVDRSAMSSELCKMRDDGLLRFEKSTFCLIS